MTQYTTPTLTLTLAGVTSVESDTVQVTIAQDTYKLIIEDDDVTKLANKISVTLSQAQSGKFKSGTARIQVRGLTADDVAYATNIVEIDVNSVLNKAVL